MRKIKRQTKRVGVNAIRKAEAQKQHRKAVFKKTTHVSVVVVMSLSMLVLFGTLTYLAKNYIEEKLKDHGVLVLSEIKIEGLNRLNREEILDLIPYEFGDDILNIDDSLVSASLEKSPWIKFASVVSGNLTTMKIKIIEAKPLGFKYEDSVWEVLSDQAQVLRGKTIRHYELPIISAPTNTSYKNVIRVLDRIYTNSYMLFGEVSQAVALINSDVEIFLNGSKYKLLINGENFDDNTIENYSLLKNSYPQELRNAKIIDLRYEGFAYVQ